MGCPRAKLSHEARPLFCWSGRRHVASADRIVSGGALIEAGAMGGECLNTGCVPDLPPSEWSKISVIWIMKEFGNGQEAQSGRDYRQAA